MKKIAPYLVKTLFFAFVLAVGVGIVSMSFKGLGWIFPDDLFDQAIGLVLFDVAALTWFLVLVYNSESTMQYVFAVIGFLVGLLGTFGLIGIEVGISSGMLQADAMTRPLTYVFIAVFMGHLTLIYMFHGSAPHMEAKISLGMDKAKIIDEGRKQAEQQLAGSLPQLGAAISARLVSEVMRDLDLSSERGQVIDVKALPMNDAGQSPAPAAAQGVSGFLKDWVLNVGAKNKKYEQVVAAPVEKKEVYFPEKQVAHDFARRMRQAFFITCAVNYDFEDISFKVGDELTIVPLADGKFDVCRRYEPEAVVVCNQDGVEYLKYGIVDGEEKAVTAAPFQEATK